MNALFSKAGMGLRTQNGSLPPPLPKPFRKSALVPLGLYLILGGIILPLPLSQTATLAHLKRWAVALGNAPVSLWLCVLAGIVCCVIGAATSHRIQATTHRPEAEWSSRVSRFMLCIPPAELFVFFGVPMVNDWLKRNLSLMATLWIASAVVGLLYGVRAVSLLKATDNASNAAVALHAGSLFILGIAAHPGHP
jgi:uncharacterized membrane protein YgdD (TMEM256/DUF423 family)